MTEQGELKPNPTNIRILSFQKFSDDQESKIIFLCWLSDDYQLFTNRRWETIGLAFPKTENDKIAKTENFLKLNNLKPNDEKITFSLTQATGDEAIPHSPIKFGYSSIKGGQVMVFNSPDLNYLARVSNLFYDIKNKELTVEVNGFNYQASEKKLTLEITKQDLAEHIYKKTVPVTKIVFSGNNPAKLSELHKIIEYNFNKNEKQFTIKKIDNWPFISTWGALEMDLEHSFPNLIVEGALVPQTTDPLLAEKNAAIADIDNALAQDPKVDNNELETTNQNWRHDIQNANDLPTITAIKNRVLVDIKNKRQAKQGGGSDAPGSPGTPGEPGDSPDNGNGSTTPSVPSKNNVPPPSKDEVEIGFNNDPAKQQIENNPQLTEEEKQAVLKLLKTLIAAEILSEKGQFNQAIFDELFGERDQQSTAYKTLNENGRIDNVIESLQGIKQASQNVNQPTKDNKGEFPVWIFPVGIFLITILVGAIVLISKKKKKKNINSFMNRTIKKR